MPRGRYAARRKSRWLTFARVRAICAGALVLGVGATATLAAWTDEEYARSTISAGSFKLESRVAGGGWQEHSAGNPALLPLEASGVGSLYPGQSRAAWIQIRSQSGSVPGTVTLDGVSLANDPDPLVDPHKALGEALTVRIGAGADTGACTDSFSGGQVVSGVTNLPVVSPVSLPSSATIATFCVVVSLPDDGDGNDATNAAQGGEVIPTWLFLGSTAE
ncbi:MAG: SipW-dependent-type signal peptide-containing protein [Leucobacter sp.]